MRNLFRLATVVAVLVAAPAAAQNVKTGVDAWTRGDYRAAVDQWRGPALAGDADAQYNLGQAYKLGRGVPVDPGLAESWFRKAALQGHLQAEDNYGLALFTAGKKADAVPWLDKSIARGEPRAQLVLGTMLFNGDGVPRDYPRAYALMTRASQQGMTSASETLAQMDQYISAQDRQQGIAMAQQMAAQAKPLIVSPPTRDSAAKTPHAVATTPLPPSRPARVPAPERLPRTSGPAVVRAPTPEPTPPARTRGSWRVQLGAFSSQGNAETRWSQVGGKLRGAQPYYVRAGKIVRLQAGGFASKAEAQRACSASGVSCVVVAP
ncbi:SPOR domain-containing protein [Sphingomonas oligophenolica]|uniref:Sporulation protein n=1 Tax=Sphingomonas oligophenolica TaxID=301154 RepID=A0A502CJR9_9SPHN|nr:SPOR domain-containing protein [Sphingomonas oligophenolica]TPG12830.1 sporulation protein [Sphingomonas oligophenolica]